VVFSVCDFILEELLIY